MVVPLLTNLNPDFTIENSIFRSIKGRTNLIPHLHKRLNMFECFKLPTFVIYDEETLLWISINLVFVQGEKYIL